MNKLSNPSPKDVLTVVCSNYGVTPSSVRELHNYSPNIHKIRNEAIFSIYTHCRNASAGFRRLSYQEIGNFMGGRPHSAIMSAIETHKKQNHGGLNA